MSGAAWRVTKVGGHRCIVNEHGGRITYIDDDCRHADKLAAAPALVEALRELIQTAEDYGDADNVAVNIAMDRARAALAQAGVTP